MVKISASYHLNFFFKKSNNKWPILGPRKIRAPKLGFWGHFWEKLFFQVFLSQSSLQHIWKPEKMADPHDSTFTEDF